MLKGRGGFEPPLESHLTIGREEEVLHSSLATGGVLCSAGATMHLSAAPPTVRTILGSDTQHGSDN